RVRCGTLVEGAHGDGHLERLTLRDAASGATELVDAQWLFVFIGAGSIVLGAHLQGGDAGGLVGVAFAHGLALAVLISALGPISGGHFNPAVTFAVWISGRIEPVRAALYVVVQLVGALI
uniref:aquaporin n=1 Tax=Clavibacter michiganensis TaxID=28447 RepID=UPI002931B486